MYTSHQSRVVGAVSPDILQFALIINVCLLRPTDVQVNHYWTSLVIYLSFSAFLSSNHGRWYSPKTLDPLPNFSPSLVFIISPVVVFFAASDLMYTAVHCWRSCVSGGWKPPLGQSADRRHLSSNSGCFSEPPQNLSIFPIFLLTVFGF